MVSGTAGRLSVGLSLSVTGHIEAIKWLRWVSGREARSKGYGFLFEPQTRHVGISRFSGSTYSVEDEVIDEKINKCGMNK